MIEFKPVTLKDKKWIDEIVMSENSRSADFNFGNIYIWDRQYSQLVARFGGRMVTQIRNKGCPSFAFPVGAGDLVPVIEELKEYSFNMGCALRLYGVEEKNVGLLEEHYPGCFEYTQQPDYSDYIYKTENLTCYKGRSFHGKKNYCNRFEKSHPYWAFVPITREIIPLCLDMLSVWEEKNRDRLDKSVTFEHDAAIRAFAAFEELGLEGGALFDGDGNLTGFSVGEMCSPDCFDVHFEKADYDDAGAYPMVCREMSKLVLKNHPEAVYINREDDMGIEGLRQSKLSYCPEYILNKYTARWQCGNT